MNPLEYLLLACDGGRVKWGERFLVTQYHRRSIQMEKGSHEKTMNKIIRRELIRHSGANLVSGFLGQLTLITV